MPVGWLAEIERRARRALANPNGGDAWEVVKQRLIARLGDQPASRSRTT
jgi:hypothetical protein